MIHVSQYTKRPITVTAIKLTRHNAQEVAQWCGGMVIRKVDDTVSVEIPTLEGVMTANEGDYIIQGVQGEFYPCKPHIFHQTYTEAS